MLNLRITENEYGYDVRQAGNWIASVTRKDDGWYVWGAFPDCLHPFGTVGEAASAAADLTFAYSI